MVTKDTIDCWCHCGGSTSIIRYPNPRISNTLHSCIFGRGKFGSSLIQNCFVVVVFLPDIPETSMWECSDDDMNLHLVCMPVVQESSTTHEVMILRHNKRGSHDENSQTDNLRVRRFLRTGWAM